MFFQLGIFSGLSRKLPILKGQGASIDYSTYYHAGILYSIFMSLLSGAVVAFIWINFNVETSVGNLAFIALLLTVTLMPLKEILDIEYRSSLHFKTLGYIMIFEHCLQIAMLALVYFYGVLGIVIFLAAKSLLSISLRFLFLGERVIFRFGTIVNLSYLVKSGFPIMLLSYLYTVLLLHDQFVVSLHFDSESFAQYNIVRLVLMLLTLVPMAVSAIFYPKISYSVGLGKDLKKELKRFFYRIILVSAGITIPLVLLILLVSHYFLLNFLPLYLEGIKLVNVAVFSVLGLILSATGTILNSLGKVKRLLGVLMAFVFFIYLFSFCNIFLFENLWRVIAFKGVVLLFYGFIVALITFREIELIKE